MAAIDDHPHVFRYEGRLWVSELPREEAHRQLVAQRAWDAATNRQQRWWIAIAIGAALGIGAILAVGITTGLPPVTYLFVLPVGFAIGAVLGAVVNKRIVGDAAPATERPSVVPLTRVPRTVVRNAPADASARDLIAWSKRGFLG